MVNVGAVAAADVGGTGVNSHALRFDLEAIDKIRSVLQIIRDADENVVAAWRQRRGESEPIEHVLGRLLLKLKAANEHAVLASASASAVIAQAVADMIGRVLDEFYNSPEQQAAQKVLLKCFL